MIRPLFLLSGLITVVLFISLQGGLSSCKKETVIEHEQDTVLTAAILTANPWKLQELKALLSPGNFVVYSRGASGNTQSFDNEYMTFNANNTGTYTDNAGVQSSFTWNFTDVANTKLVWVWNNPGGVVTITWEDIVYDDGAFRYTQSYTQSGVKAFAFGIRLPR